MVDYSQVAPPSLNANNNSAADVMPQGSANARHSIDNNSSSNIDLSVNPNYLQGKYSKEFVKNMKVNLMLCY